MILVPALADIERRATSNAERTVARLLRDITTDADALAFHSVDLRSHKYKPVSYTHLTLPTKRIV